MEASIPHPIVVVGLGNPKEAYSGTRHNIGRDYISQLSRTKGSFQKSRQTEVLRESAFLFVRLNCFMNESGPPIRHFLDSESLSAQNLLVVVDDMMIPFGSLRLRPKGSSGGHNGLNSIIEALGTEEFARLRVGVGPVPEKEDPADYVLKSFSKEEQKRRKDIFKLIEDAVISFNEQGVQKAMGTINKQHF